MKPSKRQLFFAQGWPWLLMFWGPSIALALLGGWLAPAGSMGAVLGPGIGASVGVVGMLLVLRPLQLRLARVNGAPFHNGDLVQVLAGRYRGRVGRVYAEWETRGQVRVDLGDEAKRKVQDVFGELQLCRVEEAEPAS